MAHFVNEYKIESKLNERDEEKKVPMKNITINIPNAYDAIIRKLIKMKIIPSRSEAIRTALREFLSDEFKNVEIMNDFLNDEKIEE